MADVGSIVSNVEQTLADAMGLEIEVGSYGEAKFSSCTEDSDGTPPVHCDSVWQGYASAATAYTAAVKADARAIGQMGLSFQDADEDIAAKLAGGISGTSP
jgi:type VII secretion effector (TIGR04197 family)